MATQQVKFHSVTQDAYSKIASPSDGGLYFITDNGEIRKGAQHITGSRVFTATDSTGTTSVDSLTIKYGNTSITTEGVEQPKKGDMLVVEHTLAEATGTEGQPGYVPAKKEYAAYIYSANGGTYSASGWQACDGNVDASKVILTQNITMAGNYDKIGNFTKSTNGTNATPLEGNKGTAGVSVYELIKQMLSKVQNPTHTDPSVTLTITNQTQTSLEVGQAASQVSYTASLSAGSYQSFPNQVATGITASSWSVTESKTPSTLTASSGNLPTPSVAADTAYSYTVNATATHGAGATPKDNLGGNATGYEIAAGEKSSGNKTVTIQGYRKWFYGVDRDGTSEINSAFIRTLTNGGNCETATNKQFVVGANAKRIIVAIPKQDTTKASINAAKTLKNVFLVSASNTPLEITTTTTTGYKKLASPIQVADYRGGDNGKIDYDVWVYQPASISPTEEHNIVIG